MSFHGKGSGRGFGGKRARFCENGEMINKNIVKNLNETILYLTEQLNNRETIITNLQAENDKYRHIIQDNAKCLEYVREEKRKRYILFEEEEMQFQQKYTEDRMKRYEEFSKKQKK